MKKYHSAENTYFDLVPFVSKVFILVLFYFYVYYFLLCSVADLSRFFISLGLLFYFFWYKRM